MFNSNTRILYLYSLEHYNDFVCHLIAYVDFFSISGLFIVAQHIVLTQNPNSPSWSSTARFFWRSINCVLSSKRLRAPRSCVYCPSLLAVYKMVIYSLLQFYLLKIASFLSSSVYWWIDWDRTSQKCFVKGTWWYSRSAMKLVSRSTVGC